MSDLPPHQPPPHHESKHQMSCAYPATRWEDALPTGNGSVGALVYGNVHEDTIVVNHEALWLHSEKPEPPNVSDALPELREALAAGEWAFLDRFLDIVLTERGYHPGRTDPYHPAFEIRVTMPPNAPFQEYRRALDFTTGEARVTWREDATAFQRTCFVSRVHDLICLRISSSRPGAIHARIQLARRELTEENHASKDKPRAWAEIPLSFETGHEAGYCQLVGTRAPDGATFGGVMRVDVGDARGASVQVNGSTVHVENATEVVARVKLFVGESPGRALPRLRAALAETSRDYSELLAAHVVEHAALYRRVELDLGAASADRARSNEELLLASYGGKVSPALLERLFHYGRFLLVASSRPGGWPANLQGVWNGNYFPAWSSDYHNDENIQMNYWAALPGVLPECMRPFFAYYEAALPDYRRNARAVYGCRGILVPIAQAVKGEAPLYGGPWLNWTAAAGWLAQHFYDYWLFTRDEQFLRDHALPFLGEVAAFYEDFLVEGADGSYQFAPSLSPENVPDVSGASLVTVNATMDVAVCREVLTHLCEGWTHLGETPAELSRWRAMLAKLPAYAVNADGALKEWIHPELPDHYAHRHLSHLYPLFPGTEITRTGSPALFEACRVAVEKRRCLGQTAQSGWSWAHLANVYARLHDGPHALTCLETLTRACVGPNLFTYHNDWRRQGLSVSWNFLDRIFQIDANFGLTAAILEMVVGSTPTSLTICPAVSPAWARGCLRGVATRCHARVDVRWDWPAREIDVTVLAGSRQAIVVHFPGPLEEVSRREVPVVSEDARQDPTERWVPVALDPNSPTCIPVELFPGLEVTLKAVLARER